MASVKSIADQVVKTLENYDYETFLVGASVPHTILDNDDELRSRFKIKGRDGLKSQITKMLSQKVKLQTAKLVNYSKPDLTVLVSIVDRQISVNVRSLWLSGKYVKLKRGLPQRSSTCEVCNGLGCAECGYRGSSLESVQTQITNFLVSTFEAESCNFVWLGSEDENSLVKPPGRTFYVEVVRPKKRFAMKDGLKSTPKRNPIFFRSPEIQIRDLVLLDRRVTEVPTFEIQAKVYLKRKPEAAALNLDKIKALRSNFTAKTVSVRLSRKFRTVQKEIHWIHAKLQEDGSLELKISCDGGIPLKKLISGQDDSVLPNLGQYLTSYEIDRAQPFDVMEVKIREANALPLHRK